MMTVQQAFGLALQHHQAGRLVEAEAIYRRYAVVNDADLHAAAGKIAALSTMATGTITGTVARIGAR